MCVLCVHIYVCTIVNQIGFKCTYISLAWPDRFFPFFFGVAEKRVWSGLQSLLVLAPPTVVGGVNGGNVICYCLIVTRAISVVLYKRVSSHIKDLWDRQKAQFHFNQRFQNGALCTSTWSVASSF